MKIIKGILFVIFLVLCGLAYIFLKGNGFDVSRFLIGVLLVIASGIDYATLMIM